MTRHTKAFLSKKSLSVLRQDLAAEWCETSNTKSPDDVSLGSNYLATWLCKEGHIYEQKVCHRTRKNGLGCPLCAGRLRTSIEDGMPEMLKFWDYKKNSNFDPEKLTAGSQKRVWFTCAKGHSFEKRIGSYRTSLLRGREPCPYCNRSLPSADYNLRVIHPDVAADWDYSKNTCGPDDVLPSKNKPSYWWICPKGHSYDMSINARTNKQTPQGCPVCSGQRIVDVTSLSHTHPDLVPEWCDELNKPLSPNDVSAGSNKSVWWECLRGHRWQAAVFSRASGKGCSKCSNQTSRPELRLFSELESCFTNVRHREKVDGVEFDLFLPDEKVAVEYDGERFHGSSEDRDLKKNKFALNRGIHLIRIREHGLDRLSGSDILLDSDNSLPKEKLNELLLIATKNSPSLEIKRYIEADDFQNDSRFKQLVSYLPGPLPGKSFADRHPDLISEWDKATNSPLTPYDLSFGSNFKASWVCPNGHTFQMTMKARHAGQSCPFCSGRAVSIERSLAHRYPELAEEWDHEKNEGKTPEQFTYASHFKAWWTCPVGHSYEAKISSRTRKPKGSGCKQCFLQTFNRD